MFYLSLTGLIVLAGGIALTVGAREWLPVYWHKMTIDAFKVLGSSIIVLGLSLFWSGVFYYVRGMSITSMPVWGRAYQVLSIAQLQSKSACKHLVLMPLEAEENESLYFFLKRNQLPKGIKVRETIVWTGRKMEILTAKNVITKRPRSSKKSRSSKK